MHNKKSMLSVAATFGLFIFGGTAANADDLGVYDDTAVSVRAELGVGAYNADLREQGGTTNWGKDFSYTDLTLGMTYFIDRFSVDGYVRTSLGEWDVEWEGFRDSTDASRTEVAATFGYQMTETVTGFAGVRLEDTEVKQNGNYFSLDTKGVTFGVRAGKVSGRHVWIGGAGLSLASGDFERRERLLGVNVSDNKNSVGGMLMAQYRYLIDDNLDFSVSGDFYYFDFGTLEAADGRRYSTDQLTGSIRAGLTYTF